MMKKIDAEAPHAVLLVLDATVGQNALSQVEIFGQKAGVTGLVMTKLDGTARGGVLQLRQAARIIGAELEAAGFNTLFGPVVDLASPDSIVRERALASTPASGASRSSCLAARNP